MKHSLFPYKLIKVVLVSWLIGGPFLAEAAEINYDPPQASAEFGTPKTIVKILTSATFGHSLARYDGKKV
jgi:hypothetical protein